MNSLLTLNVKDSLNLWGFFPQIFLIFFLHFLLYIRLCRETYCKITNGFSYDFIDLQFLAFILQHICWTVSMLLAKFYFSLHVSVGWHIYLTIYALVILKIIWSITVDITILLYYGVKNLFVQKMFFLLQISLPFYGI